MEQIWRLQKLVYDGCFHIKPVFHIISFDRGKNFYHDDVLKIPLKTLFFIG